MDIQFVAGFAPIAPDPDKSLAFYLDALGLPLEGEEEYKSTWELDGAKHFGVWPLSHAARTCFGTEQWPEDIPIPQATLEFEMRSIEAMRQGLDELVEKGYEAVHGVKQEPWGQTVARLLSPEGLLIGLSYAPWFHGD